MTTLEMIDRSPEGSMTMPQIYTDPTRESDPHALPNAEVFSANAVEATCRKGCVYVVPDIEGDVLASGVCPSCGAGIEYAEPIGLRWFWWPCFPGCLPDGEIIGPFATEAEAIADAQDGCDNE